MKTDLSDYRKLFDLTGRTALVAGGAGGIGSAVSAGLAAAGATVYMTARTQEKADLVAAQICEAGGNAKGVVLISDDISRMQEQLDAIIVQAGGIDILVNSVGTHIEAPAEAYREEDWNRVLDVNLKAAFFISQAVAKHQIASARGGKHIHITSVRSILGLKRGYISYCASRGGMNMMIKQLATEWAKYGITVNGIGPTFTRTSLVAEYLDDPAFYNPLVARIPLGRVCEPTDIAGLAMYLAAPVSDFITGQIVYVDGGLTACQ